MKMLKSDAVELCVALGWKAASGWNRPRLSDKLKEAFDMGPDEVRPRLDDVLAKRYDEIVEADGLVEIVNNPEDLDSPDAKGIVDNGSSEEEEEEE